MGGSMQKQSAIIENGWFYAIMRLCNHLEWVAHCDHWDDVAKFVGF